MGGARASSKLAEDAREARSAPGGPTKVSAPGASRVGPTADRGNTVRRIMSEFAERTGLSSARTPRRYLWTDAFAVCNFLELHTETGAGHDRALAERLVDQVHRILGRHRDDDSRTGWISGLSEQDGRTHPTRGGLRIGKQLSERSPGEPYDPRSEWDRDGQYFHYLARWMHALGRLAAVTGRRDALLWAIELAQSAYRGFAHAARDGRPSLVWKMSIDLTRPLVPSAGHHDPLDGLITFLELRSAAAQPPRSGQAAALEDSEAPSPAPLLRTTSLFDHSDRLLEPQIAALSEMCQGVDWTTTDALGLGGLLTDAYRLAQLMARGDGAQRRPLLERILLSAEVGMGALVRADSLGGPAAERLPFRELGLAIGLHALEPLEELIASDRLLFGGAADAIPALRRYLPLTELIESFWLDERNQRAATWSGHLDINAVMLATSLAPATYLSI